MITKAMFAPLALIFTAIFMMINLCLLPFAYVTSIVKKIKLLRAKNKISIFNFSLQRELQGKAKKKVQTEQNDQATCSDLVLFMIFGPIFLLLAWCKDAYHFLILEYREEDVRDLSRGEQKDYILTEEQFEVLEEFCGYELKKLIYSEENSFGTEEGKAYVSTKEFILGFRKKIGVTEILNKMMFGDVDERELALTDLKFFN